MIDRFQSLPVAKGLERLQDWLMPALLRRRIFFVAAVCVLLAVVYWGLIASDRYVSEAQIVIERTDVSAGSVPDLGSLLSGATGGNRIDQMQLRTYLLSFDMLKKLDAQLDLRAHYSDLARDPLSRMWGKGIEDEWFHRHYLKRTSVEYDEYSGVLVLRVEAYDAKMANAIARMLVNEGERYMNELGHSMARDQVSFLEKQVDQMAQRALEARQMLVRFQNQKGLISPQASAEALQKTISQLEVQLVEYKTRRAAMLGYLSPQAPGIVELDMQIRAVEKQIQQEQAKLTSPQGKTLNTMIEEYQRLELAAKFAEDVYKSALVGLEKGRIEAMRTLKKVAVLQAPTLPQYPWEPRRFYNIIVFVLAAIILAGIVHLIAAIIRDHRD